MNGGFLVTLALIRTSDLGREFASEGRTVDVLLPAVPRDGDTIRIGGTSYTVVGGAIFEVERRDGARTTVTVRARSGP